MRERWPLEFIPPRRIRCIVRAVAKKHGTRVYFLLGPRRYGDLVRARFEAYWRIREKTGASTPQIAKFMGRKDHTTILHGIKVHEKRRREPA